jgi:hypothetical protein
VRIYYLPLYRPLMRLAHRFNWHHMPPVFPNGEEQRWCRWCGLAVRMPAPKAERLGAGGQILTGSHPHRFVFLPEAFSLACPKLGKDPTTKDQGQTEEKT